MNSSRHIRPPRPRGPDIGPPRDIICCLQNFQLKEVIMRKARRNERIVFNGENIMLFQDLSQITLKKRRALRPLLDKLRDRDLKYSWRFLFALVVSSNVHQHILRTPAELPNFCAGLRMDFVDLPDWYADFTLPPTNQTHSQLSTPEKRIPKKMRHGKAGGSKSDTPNPRSMPSWDQAEG